MPNEELSKRKTEIIYGSDDAAKQWMKFMQNIKNKMDIISDYSGLLSINESQPCRSEYFYSTVEEMEQGKLSHVIISNEPLYIIHFSDVFEQTWKNAVDAKGRIKNIQDRVAEVEPKVSYNEENIKHYLDEAMKEIEKIRGLRRRTVGFNLAGISSRP